MSDLDSRFINDLLDPERRRAAIRRARIARTILGYMALVVLFGLAIVSVITGDVSWTNPTLGVMVVAFYLWIDVLVKLLIAFDKAGISEQQGLQSR